MVLKTLMAVMILSLLAGILFVLRTGLSANPTAVFAPSIDREATHTAGGVPAAGASLLGATPAHIMEVRKHYDQTVFAKEVDAQEYEQTFIAMWDAMRQRLDDQHVVLEHVPIESITLRHFGAFQSHRWSIRTASMDGNPETLDVTRWQALIEDLAHSGYRLVHSEWHHASMDVDDHGVRHSLFNIKLFIQHPDHRQRLVVAGSIGVTWSDQSDPAGHHLVRYVDATNLSLTERTGPDAFTEVVRRAPPLWQGQSQYSNLSPVLVYDLRHTGLPDIIIPSLNAILRNTSTPGTVSFTPERLFKDNLTGIKAAVIADFNGDGIPDLLIAGVDAPLLLFYGNGMGGFGEGRPACPGVATDRFQLPMCITAGDVDGDGRVDFFLGQYRMPYEDGNIPSPYYDANDGNPSFLFLNNGDGTFRDATEDSGLGAKRNRRTYSASLVDLEGTGHLDLLTVNDFSGIDAYHNDGRGHFTDVTASLFDERSGFGMSSAIADFTGEGRLDVFVAGMGSTTARRLEHFKLGRPEFPAMQDMRMKMAYGNRLYLGRSDHRYVQAPFADQVARTGWSWGCTALDVGNDGLMDLFVANGHMSRQSAKDYCTRFWTQDIYMGNSQPNEAFATVFNQEEDQLGSISWNGFEHKALLMNEGGTSFRDVAFVMNLGFEWDGREVISADLDGDGLEDLILIQSIAQDKRTPAQEILHVVRNQMPSSNHWIEVQLQDEPGCPVQGARVEVKTADHTYLGVIVSGDSYRCQHPLAKHFGLGATVHVDTVDVTWPNGRHSHLVAPAVDQRYLLHPQTGP